MSPCSCPWVSLYRSCPEVERTYLCLGIALALPLTIETTQLLVPSLARGCQSGDVIDNLAGLLLGLVVGTGCRLIASRGSRGLDA